VNTNQSKSTDFDDPSYKSIHRCAACGHFLDVSLVSDGGFRRQKCDVCGWKPEAGTRVDAGEPAEVITETLSDGKVVVAGPGGGYVLTFNSAAALGLSTHSKYCCQKTRTRHFLRAGRGMSPGAAMGSSSSAKTLPTERTAPPGYAIG
jgi:hypothetical protein